MANLIREHRMVDNQRRALIKYVFVSDGTNQSNTTLIDVSTLSYAKNANGYIMTANADPRLSYRTTIKRIFGNMKSSGLVKLQWCGAQNSEIVVLSTGQFDYNFSDMGGGAVIPNPEIAPANNGDILITTTGAAAGDGFTLIIDLKKDGADYDPGANADPIAFRSGF